MTYVNLYWDRVIEMEIEKVSNNNTMVNAAIVKVQKRDVKKPADSQPRKPAAAGNEIQISSAGSNAKKQLKGLTSRIVKIEKMSLPEVNKSLKSVINHITKTGKASIRQAFGGERVNRSNLLRVLESAHVGITTRNIAGQIERSKEDVMGAAVSYRFDSPTAMGLEVRVGKTVETPVVYIEFVDGVLIKITRKTVTEGSQAVSAPNVDPVEILNSFGSEESFQFFEEISAEPAVSQEFLGSQQESYQQAIISSSAGAAGTEEIVVIEKKSKADEDIKAQTHQNDNGASKTIINKKPVETKQTKAQNAETVNNKLKENIDIKSGSQKKEAKLASPPKRIPSPSRLDSLYNENMFKPEKDDTSLYSNQTV